MPDKYDVGLPRIMPGDHAGLPFMDAGSLIADAELLALDVPRQELKELVQPRVKECKNRGEQKKSEGLLVGHGLEHFPQSGFIQIGP